MSNFCENENIKRLEASDQVFTIQLDQTTGIAGLSTLLIIVRYIHETAAQEDMLIFKSLPTRPTADIVNSYFKKHDISWDLCHQVCTDGATAMLGKLNGVVARMKQNNYHT
ncbi:transposase [Nephila pilipes]|uniref:Transposase n=1 Tax=Nephila pilipes TaxID=299642 RepID=A0A8X6MUE3_NEPPI|nr:transposase [Nephila pilipes]